MPDERLSYHDLPSPEIRAWCVGGRGEVVINAASVVSVHHSTLVVCV